MDRWIGRQCFFFLRKGNLITLKSLLVWFVWWLVKGYKLEVFFFFFFFSFSSRLGLGALWREGGAWGSILLSTLLEKGE